MLQEFQLEMQAAGSESEIGGIGLNAGSPPDVRTDQLVNGGDAFAGEYFNLGHSFIFARLRPDRERRRVVFDCLCRRRQALDSRRPAQTLHSIDSESGASTSARLRIDDRRQPGAKSPDARHLKVKLPTN